MAIALFGEIMKKYLEKFNALTDVCKRVDFWFGGLVTASAGVVINKMMEFLGIVVGSALVGGVSVLLFIVAYTLVFSYIKNKREDISLIEAAAEIYPTLESGGIRLGCDEPLEGIITAAEILDHPKKESPKIKINLLIKETVSFLGKFIKNGTLPVYGKKPFHKKYEQIPIDKMEHWNEDYTKLYTSKKYKWEEDEDRDVYVENIICKRKDLRRIQKYLINSQTD